MKKVKFILPTMAIVFAVVGVSATGNSKSALAPVNVSLVKRIPPPCIKDGTCSNVGATCATASGIGLWKIEPDKSCPNLAVGTFTYAP
jgi:hypothetical protein